MKEKSGQEWLILEKRKDRENKEVTSLEQLVM